jgi:molybdopterin-containing oxidoreductase family iron-sulfur binding subunit
VNKTYWRSLNELENKAEFLEVLHREFPQAAAEYPEGISRRRWLQLMGASLALGGLGGCRWEKEILAPEVKRPANRIPGVPKYFATSREQGGYGQALLLQSYDGRPIKVEGNPQHPASLGATTQFAQASILGLYDPDRLDKPTRRHDGKTEEVTWETFEKDVLPLFERAERGSGIAVLAEPSSSISRADLKRRFLEKYPSAKWFEYQAISQDNAIQGSQIAFGSFARTHLNVADASVIVALDYDLFKSYPNSIKLTREWADRRVPTNPKGMVRLYAAESQMTTTGANADHRLAVRSNDIPAVLAQIEALVDEGLANPAAIEAKIKAEKSAETKIILAAAHDLVSNQGKGIIAIGPSHSPALHARVHRLNGILKNAGATVTYTEEPFGGSPAGIDQLRSLVEAMNGKLVGTLLILGGNPAYNAPKDIDFGAALKHVDHAIHLSLYDDETSTLSEWSVPLAHEYEVWGDTRSYDGTVTIRQPLIAPLLGGRSEIEILAWLAGDKVGEISAETTVSLGERIVRRSLQPFVGNDEARWQKAVHEGFIENTPFAAATVSVKGDIKPGDEKPSEKPKNGEIEVVFTESPHTYDGRYANNGWLLETPDFITKLVWENAALVSPETASALGIADSTFVELTLGKNTISLPAFIVPGLAFGSIGLEIGFGRTMAGVVGGFAPAKLESIGVDVGPLRNSDAFGFAKGVSIKSTGKKATLATTQEHFAIESLGSEETGRRSAELIREANLDEFEKHRDFAAHMIHSPPNVSLWKNSYTGKHQWGMAIDLAKCIGCSSCVTACQAENNIPIVGKEQVARGREMQWLRVDRYFAGDRNNPEVAFQPMTCQQCENAPCEQVCPVAATVHSDEGLNDMVYNRCIGTRYCANNCPYKVRRFNYFHFTGYLDKADKGNEILRRMLINPEVTVRTRGVMEKCTYCVQRIQNVKIEANNQQRPIKDGEIKTACQQACASGAIVFGDLADKDSEVSKQHADDRAYAVLGELNVHPRTRYLARVRNPHPALAVPRLKGHHGGEHGHGHDHEHHEKHEEGQPAKAEPAHS